MKKLFANMALIAGGIVFALLVCEAALRLTGAGSMVISYGSMYQNDPAAGWTCSPNSNERFYLPGAFDVRIVCNSKGLRDSEKDYAKAPGTRRILMLGDSFIWGHGVENSAMVSTVLQDMLPGCETVNFGVKGYSTVQEVVRLESEGVRYEPDMALLFFCWNDLEDNFDSKDLSRPVAELEGDDDLRIVNSPVQNCYKSPVKLWLQANCRTFAFARYSLELLEEKFKTKRGRGELRAQLPADEARVVKKKPQGRMEFSLPELYAPPTPELDRAWTAVRLLLERARDTMARAGGRLAVVYVPTLEGTDRLIFSAEMQRAGYDPDEEDFDWNRPSSRLAGICRGLGVAYIDPTPVFRAYPDHAALFSKRDAHWSPTGHRLVAETVAASIADIEKGG